MSGLEALQAVQYVTAKGKRLAVIGVDEWEALIEWLETLEDIQIAKQALAELEAFGGDRARWLAALGGRQRGTGVSRYTVYIIPRAWQEMKNLPGNIRQRARRAVDG